MSHLFVLILNFNQRAIRFETTLLYDTEPKNKLAEYVLKILQPGYVVFSSLRYRSCARYIRAEVGLWLICPCPSANERREGGDGGGEGFILPASIAQLFLEP